MITKLNYLLLNYFVRLMIFAPLLEMYMWFVRRARTVFLRSAGTTRARCIIARLLEPALPAALNQPKRARQTSFLRVARSAPIEDALRWGINILAWSSGVIV